MRVSPAVVEVVLAAVSYAPAIAQMALAAKKVSLVAAEAFLATRRVLEQFLKNFQIISGYSHLEKWMDQVEHTVQTEGHKAY